MLWIERVLPLLHCRVFSSVERHFFSRVSRIGSSENDLFQQRNDWCSVPQEPVFRDLFLQQLLLPSLTQQDNNYSKHMVTGRQDGGMGEGGDPLTCFSNGGLDKARSKIHSCLWPHGKATRSRTSKTTVMSRWYKIPSTSSMVRPFSSNNL